MSFSFGLIGYPIQHSLSPWIHEQFLKRTNVTGTYDIYEIHPEADFAAEMDNLKQQQLDGFNITAPYKEKIIPYLDEMDAYAEKIGAVNTVLCKDGQWIGYNTDGIGYVRALESKYPYITATKDKSILILGAGGATKGIYQALIENDYDNITIANRTIEKAQTLTQHHATSKAITREEAENNSIEYDIIINTSSVGMKPNIHEVIISLKQLKKDVIVSDIVYQPLMTQLLHDAKELGANIHFGHTMLLYQAQYAYEIWTDLHPNMDQLDDALQQVLEG